LPDVTQDEEPKLHRDDVGCWDLVYYGMNPVEVHEEDVS
jgi:hypothetical protein